MQKVELNELLGVGCFKAIDMKAVPHGRKIVGSRWIHSYKSDELGYYVKTRSQMVAKEFTQMPNVDYHETTSSAPASALVNIITFAANKLGLPVFHLDVSQAFVQAPLEDEIYMRTLPRCGELSGKIVRLLKRQYDLKQAGREWHLLLKRWLVEMTRMEQCKAEPCIFRKMVNDKVSLMVRVHVDDIVVSEEQDIMCDEFFDIIYT